MITIAMLGLDEAEVLCHWNRLFQNAGPIIGGVRILRAREVHHRNKGRGARLNDQRWWMAASRQAHDNTENHKTWARAEGYLLPIQADAEGRWGDGNQALTTPELMESKVKHAAQLFASLADKNAKKRLESAPEPTMI
jgi:hypothetical protein